MNDERKTERILSLAYEISKYHLSNKDVLKIVNRIEAKYGEFSLPLDLNNYSDTADESVLVELNNLVHEGVCSKEIILKMSAIANNLHPELITAFKKKKLCICCLTGTIIIFALILAICLAL